MALVCRILTIICMFSALCAVQCTNYQPKAIQLTEATWQDMLKGEWMVEFVKDGVFRQYVAGRTESDLITFIDDKRWQDVQSVSKWTAPDSIQMGMVGMFFKMAMKIRAFYTLMTEVYGIPEWGCYVIFALLTIVTGLLLGLLLVCLCDFMSPAKEFAPPIPQGLMQPSMDKDGDIIDDTQVGDWDTPVRRRNVQKNDDDNDRDDDSNTNDTDDVVNGAQTTESDSKKDK